MQFEDIKLEEYSIQIGFYFFDKESNNITKELLKNNNDFEGFENFYLITNSNIGILKFVLLLNSLTNNSNYVLGENIYLEIFYLLINKDKLISTKLTYGYLSEIEKREKINLNKSGKCKNYLGNNLIEFEILGNNIVLKIYEFKYRAKKRLLFKYTLKDSKKFIKEINLNIEYYKKIKNLILEQEMSTQLMESIVLNRRPEICKQRRNFVPWKSVGPLKFGMNIENVVKILKTKGRKFTKDDYTHFIVGFNIEYDQNHNIEFINNFGSVEIYFKDEKLFPSKFLKTIKLLKTYDEPVPYRDGYVFYKLGISVERMDYTQADIESIGFWSKGYCEKFIL